MDRQDWKAPAIIVAIVTAVVAVVAVIVPPAIEHGRQADRENPVLTPNGRAYPSDPTRPSSCFVPFTNKDPSARSILVTAVSFKMMEETTQRPVASAPPAIVRVNFTHEHLNRKTNTFKLTLPQPELVKGGDTAVFALAIIEPSWGTVSYLGKAWIHYDNDKSEPVDALVSVLHQPDTIPAN